MSCLLSKPSSLLKNPISRGAGVLPEVRKVDRGTSSSAVISLGFLVAVSHLSEARAKLGSKIFPFDKFLWLIFLHQGDGCFHAGAWVIIFMDCFGNAKALGGVSVVFLDRARYVSTFGIFLHWGVLVGSKVDCLYFI